ncbi:dihydrodipicolinate synthase family protein [Methylocapsa sp. S129]|uniref:dihydrodipicolinate synthase family protein n=1 Tax=Methylocapsa sp. S129 TaxID=1641869 RepID=UPI00131CA265|nr:dihydrodipicolinate synthase family protein [Methylocapsa sp. S129]
MPAHKISETTRGVFIIAPTPFDESGAVDAYSTDTLVDFFLAKGVTGITILGVLGEAPKLSAIERKDFMTQTLRRVAGRVQIVVGASDAGTDNLVRFAREAMDLGAAGLMIAPVAGLKTDDHVYDYWAAVLEKLGPNIPVCYQDYPQTTTVVSSVSVLNRLIDAFPNFVMLKHEDCPGLGKITSLRDSARDGARRRVSILVGNGGLYLPQELRRGADGAMTGFAFPEMLVEVCAKFSAGAAKEAENLFDLYLPVLRHEQQPGFGLAIRKEILRRRGAIKSAKIRHPGPSLTPADHRELDGLLVRLNNRLGA